MTSTTDIAIRSQGGTLANLPANDPLAGWLEAAADAQTLAQGLVRSFFVPQAYKPNPREEGAYETAVANATGAILLGRSLGLDPLTSLQQIYVVHGRPGMYTKLKVALAQAAGHRVWDEIYSPERAIVCGQRKGTDDVVRIEITIQMAKDAGWTDNAAYRKTPADMLWARAAGRVVDRIAADLLMGVRSIEDIDPDDIEVTAAPPAPRMSAAAILAASTTDPAHAVDRATAERVVAETRAAAEKVVERLADDPEIQRYILPVSKQQLDLLKARFEQLGIGGRSAAMRESRMRVLCELTARDITDPRQLTNDEAKLCIDNLIGNPGLRICQDLGVLPDDPQADIGEPKAAPASDPAGDYDPTVDQDWPGDTP